MLDRNTVNKIILVGRIVTEPYWRNIEGRRALCFKLLTAEKIRTNGETLIHEEWHNIQIPERISDSSALGTGSYVYIQGRIQTKMHIDENRVKRYNVDIIATSLDVLTTEPALKI